MSKDYKQSARKGSSSRRNSGGGGSSVFAGLLIGLCVGIAIALAAALYLNKAPNPFAQGSKAAAPKVEAQPPKPEILLPPGSDAPASAPDKPGQAKPAAKPDADRFDFYTMLPGLDGEAKPAPAGKTPEASPPAKVVPPAGTYLQAGAFQNETDADNLKAKLALLGVEANIQTADLPGKGVLHRVRIGPLPHSEDIDRVRAQLKVNGIEASLVRQ